MFLKTQALQNIKKNNRTSLKDKKKHQIPSTTEPPKQKTTEKVSSSKPKLIQMNIKKIQLNDGKENQSNPLRTPINGFIIHNHENINKDTKTPKREINIKVKTFDKRNFSLKDLKSTQSTITTITTTPDTTTTTKSTTTTTTMTTTTTRKPPPTLATTISSVVTKTFDNVKDKMKAARKKNIPSN